MTRWTVDAAHLREFIQETRAHYEHCPFPPSDLLDVCEKHAQSGIEVVFRDDGVFVGSWHLSFVYTEVTWFRLGEACIWFRIEWGSHEIPVPLAKGGQADAEHVIAYYHRLFGEHERQAMAQRLAPTWSNRLLDFVEAHFVLAMFGFFFMAIPIVVLIIGWLRGGLQ